MNDSREIRTEMVCLLEELISHSKVSNDPSKYIPAVKKLRREVLGMYTKAINAHKPVQNQIDTPKEVVLCEQASPTTSSDNNKTHDICPLSNPDVEINRSPLL